MNNKEKLKTQVCECMVNGTMTIAQGAARLGFSERYTKKLKRRFKSNVSMMHGNCGRQPKHTLSPEIKQKILELKNLECHETANFKHFKEILMENFNINISYSALSTFLKNNGVKSHRKHRKKKFHHTRKRRSQSGALLQGDATPHKFFYGDERQYTLHGFIDDATGAITGLHMTENECMEGYFEVTRQTLENFGVPEALYVDGSSIFFSNKKEELTIQEELDGIEDKNTQYGRIMDFLGVTLIHAHSSQAKGRIERLWNTLHDRLITEFRIHNIKTIDDANVFLKNYIPQFNAKFSIVAENPTTLFIPLRKDVDLDTLLTVKYTRVVDNGACFSLKNIRFKIKNIDILPRQKIEILISKRLSMKVRYKEKLYDIEPIYPNIMSPQKNTSSIDSIINEFVYFFCLKNERVA